MQITMKKFIGTKDRLTDNHQLKSLECSDTSIGVDITPFTKVTFLASKKIHHLSVDKRLSLE